MTPPRKRCFKCGETKPLNEFYRHPMMADGHLGKCKPCTRRDVQENYLVNLEKIKEYRQRRPKRQQHHDPVKNRAQHLLNYAVAMGRMLRQPCQVCGEPNGHAHHHDYSKPYDVQWLCRKHHGMAHRIDNERRLAF